MIVKVCNQAVRYQIVHYQTLRYQLSVAKFDVTLVLQVTLYDVVELSIVFHCV
ncbi:hypothetical protein VCR3J2_80354 [Vibrio coralliirubri]|nr:hypothetical protein VCR3J2_80354 [Vibrio coralliirubri]